MLPPSIIHLTDGKILPTLDEVVFQRNGSRAHNASLRFHARDLSRDIKFTKVLETANMEAENNPEANGSDQPTTKDTADVTQDTPKTNGETTPETLAMPSPAKAR